MTTLQIPTAEVFEPLLKPARYKGAWGGRGSGKSHFFGENLIDDSIRFPGLRSVCIREVQKTLKESAKRLLEDKIESLGVGALFDVQADKIVTPGNGVIIFQGMQDHTAESIKSLEGFGRAWCEEAQTLSDRSLSLLRPTIRGDDSELWFSWNPRLKSDPVDKLLRGDHLPTGAVVVRANWSDNPWFPAVLEQERQDCLQNDPDQYDHIWEGGYITVVKGAYYAKHLSDARRERRIGRVSADPLMTIRLFCDIGGTGAKADAFTIWAAQFIGHEVRLLNYYEAVGQPLEAHVNWLRANGYTPDRAQIWLPHDGTTHDRVFKVTYESAFKRVGYKVTVIPNQGSGAATQRIEAVRRALPACWFNEATTTGGLDALGWYHEKIDEHRQIGLGPDHDWSSHGCFLGETKVITRHGLRKFTELPETGEVLTPCGWREYINPRITKKNAQLVEVTFTDGYSVKCTPDHLFLTASGWKSAESLTPNTAIQSTLMPSRSILTEVYTAFGRMIGIYREVASEFIEMCGLRLLAQSLTTVTSTTEMEIRSTTGWKTWSASTAASIYRLAGTKKPKTWSLDSLTSHKTPETKRLIGINQKKEGCGTDDMLSESKAGRNGSERISLASIARRHLARLFGKTETLECTAHLRAKQPRIEREGKPQSTGVVIKSVRPLKERADVWDITVPDGHCFSLANGAVVHNSDGFGLMALVYLAQPKQKPREVYRIHRPRDRAMGY